MKYTISAKDKHQEVLQDLG